MDDGQSPDPPIAQQGEAVVPVKRLDPGPGVTLAHQASATEASTTARL
jgi:hypothetical protein